MLIQELLQQRDELYGELSRLRNADIGTLETIESRNKELEAVIKEQDDKIRQLTDQLAWYRRKLWSPSKEKFIPEDPNQRKIDFDGLELLPEEEENAREADKEIISYERQKPGKEKKKPFASRFQRIFAGKKKS